MPETVFWDTAAFVALGNAKDDLHQAAINVSQELAQATTQVLTTDAVLTEVANTFSKVVWRPTGWQIIEAIQASVAMEMAVIVHIDSELWQQGWQLYRSRSDKDWGLTDCISFVVMEAYHIRQAFTYDHHFEQAGFIRLLK
ncbi:MAG TPA: PIN domain-containing protein [Anaerolineae bacterium]|nr:PIN domain-containing protein [Anaerolineae bacterium]